VLGLDKVTPLAQAIVSHRDADSGTGSDPFNSGFDRVMLSPGVEFTKVVDQTNNRVVKVYADVEVPVYYPPMPPTTLAPKASLSLPT
jgi:hypothetical protein